MINIVQKSLPDFLLDRIVYCNYVVHKCCGKTIVVLSKDLHLYEYQRKRLISSTNLGDTCLRNIKALIEEYQGPKSKWADENHSISNDTDVMETTTSSPEKNVDTSYSSDIYFGKYIYQNIDVYKFYLLVICWDKMIVLRRSDDGKEYYIHAEFEKVMDFKLVHGQIKFEVLVEIMFKDGSVTRTNFQESDDVVNQNHPAKKPRKEQFEELLDRVRVATTELYIHREMTQKLFDRLKKKQCFGSNLVRSFNLEEKQMIGRCGDSWVRFTTDDTLVIGFPLVSNCSSPNLTILKNVHPLLKLPENIQCIDYNYRLYQLQQKFENLESLETYFQSEVNNIQNLNWAPQKIQQLLPESFAVLLVKFNIRDIINLEDCPMFLHFEIEKSFPQLAESITMKPELSEQYVFLKIIHFNRILQQRQAHEITFKENTLHQDFLAIAMSSIETKIALKFKSISDVISFETLFCDKFDFEKLNRCTSRDEMALEIESNTTRPPTMMHVSTYSLYYNRRPFSMWYGLLSIQETDGEDPTDTFWKFYTKTEEKAYLLIKLLFDDLAVNCNVSKVKYPAQNLQSLEIAEFENSLRHELMTTTEYLKGKSKNSVENDHALLIELLNAQTQTDLIASEFLQ